MRRSAGGGWSAEVAVSTNGHLRTVAGDRVSNEVAVRTSPRVDFAPLPSGGHRASIGGQLSRYLSAPSNTIRTVARRAR